MWQESRVVIKEGLYDHTDKKTFQSQILILTWKVNYKTSVSVIMHGNTALKERF